MSYQSCNTFDVNVNELKSSCASKFKKFEPLSLDSLKAIIESMPSKTCDFDPLPTSILKKCIDLALPAIHHIVNLSLSLSYFPDILKKACVTPLIKNENLDNDNNKNFRPVRNLPFLGKIIEKCVFSKLIHNCVKIHCMAICNQLTDLAIAVRLPLQKYTMMFCQF